MTDSRWRRLESLVEAARARAAEERAPFLAEACRDDPALHADVESLLRLESRAEGFLESPSGDGLSALFVKHGAEQLVGRRIGRFELTGVLGYGGMGVVYRAVQDNPRREVALKVVRTAGPADHRQLRLYEREVRSLARLRHPSIAAIHEAGSTDDGQHYFAMELVTGAPLTTYARDQELSQRERLALFCKVCDAVQYAHQRGVIHRDLKPSNILIEADGNPKVLDFGLAKITDADVVAATVVTEVGRVQGTLSYMSPEQAQGRSDDIDSRSDVYSLGVVLYELMTDEMPYNVLRAALPEAVRTICEEPPRRPTDLDRTLRGDLETIVLKALTKEPDRRYASAADLEREVRRFLANEPIEARRDSALYVLKKYMRRNRRALSLVAVTAFVFVTLGLVSVALRNRALERERIAAIDGIMSDVLRRLRECGSLRAAHRQSEYELNVYTAQLVAEYFPPEKDREMAAITDKISFYRLTLTESFHTVQALLSRAEKLGADANQVTRLRGREFLEEYGDAMNQGDPVRIAQLHKRVLENDPTGEWRRQLEYNAPISFSTVPEGAACYAFRVVPQSEAVAGGEPRFVPVPFNDLLPAIPPGTWALRVVDGVGSVRTGDVITQVAGQPIKGTVLVTEGSGSVSRLDRLVSIDGAPIESEYAVRAFHEAALRKPRPERARFVFQRDGSTFEVEAESLDGICVRVAEPAWVAEQGDVSAEVWRDGRLESLVLPRGLRVRRTARPLFLGPDSLAGVTPIDRLRLIHRSYVLLFRKEGFEDLIVSYVPDDKLPESLAFVLNPVGTTLAGFRLVPTNREDTFHDRFWIMETEVTAGEYLEFLNSPQALEQIARSSRPILFPRSNENAASGGHFLRDASGRFRLPDSWGPNWAVHGVSWNDAQAYAEWRTAKAQASGLHHVYSLPTLAEWVSACAGREALWFVYGGQFRPKWMSSCYARPTPGIEPVMSFPIDESMYGLFDTSGSASEWLDAWWLEDRGLRRHAGGSWADGGPEDMFGIEGGGGKLPDHVSTSIGFRVVLRTGP